MFKFMPILIGLRYILAKKDNRFISFTSLISMAGLTLGVLALIIVLSVFNGSQGLMRDRTLIVIPHGDIYAEDSFSNWSQATQILLTQENVQGVSPYTTTEAMLSEQGYNQVSQIKGIIPSQEMAVSAIEGNMYRGSFLNLEAGQHGIILGSALAGELRLNIGDPVNLIVPEVGGQSSRVTLKSHRFTVAGLLNVPFTLDANLAYIHIEDSMALLGINSLDDAVHLRLKVADVDDAALTVKESLSLLRERLPGTDYQGEDWSISEANLFNSLKMEKVMTGFMLMMIVAIGAFNIISTLVMVVSDKQADIAILRTMGASERTIMAIFMVQGCTVGIFGTVIGGIIGISIVYYFSAITAFLETFISSDSFYVISSLPAQLQMQDVLITCISALIISFLATLYPAWKASRILPAEVLRYE